MIDTFSSSFSASCGRPSWYRYTSWLVTTLSHTMYPLFRPQVMTAVFDFGEMPRCLPLECIYKGLGNTLKDDPLRHSSHTPQS